MDRTLAARDAAQLTRDGSVDQPPLPDLAKREPPLARLGPRPGAPDAYVFSDTSARRVGARVGDRDPTAVVIVVLMGHLIECGTDGPRVHSRPDGLHRTDIQNAERVSILVEDALNGVRVCGVPVDSRCS